MAKDFIINTSGLNSYGTRVLTPGIDLTQYKRNPVLLYMHTRGFDGKSSCQLLYSAMLNDANLRGLQRPNKKSVNSLQPFLFSRGSHRILHRGKLPFGSTNQLNRIL